MNIKLQDESEFPIIGLGTARQRDENTCKNMVKTAIEIGYRHIDTADIYQNHAFIKDAIKSFDRNKLFITTKLWKDFLEPDLVEENCNRALKELGLDYIDLYLIHWPDSSKPLLDVYYKMQRLQEKGKLKSLGVSNYSTFHLQKHLEQGLKIYINQVEFHPFLYQKKLLDFCNENSITLVAYCPLARGDVCEDKNLLEISRRYNKTPAQISLRWLIQKNIAVIPKASSKERLKENFNIFDFELSKEDVFLIDNLDKQKRIISPPYSEFD